MDHNPTARGPVQGALERLLPGLPSHAPATLVLRVSAVGLEFLCLLALARVLDGEAYGRYALAMTLVAIFAVPAAFGFDRLVVRELAACQAVGDWRLANGLRRSALRTVLVAGAVSAVAAWLAGRLVVQPDAADAGRAIAIAAVMVPILALARLRQATLQGLGHVTAGLAPEFLVQPAIVIALAGVLLVAPQLPRSATVAMALQMAAAAAALLLGAAILRQRMPEAMREAAPRFRTRDWRRAGMAFMALVLMTTALTNVDTLLVGRLSGNADAGVYKVASQLAMLVGLPLTAISVAMAPVIAALHAGGHVDELRLRSRAAARMIFAAACGVGVLVVACGPRVLAAFGGEFGVGYVPALILAGAYLVHSAMATSGYLLIMTAHETAVMAAFAAGTAVNVVGGLLLIPRYGLAGAAASTAVSLCLVSVTCALLAQRRLGIDGTVFAAAPDPVAPA
jgi:O-antigen/teichoic acid export membrane protein